MFLNEACFLLPASCDLTRIFSVYSKVLAGHKAYTLVHGSGFSKEIGRCSYPSKLL